uniref:Uncharacterized protein LOC117361897 n=1 Tax=Geotrypetes seraphini TaxID=260995 RepID=A0A6P8RJD6_GEOSA|nr:uncharacterized protein LOC117361897 [Geotrypetes seraphini]
MLKRRRRSVGGASRHSEVPSIGTMDEILRRLRESAMPGNRLLATPAGSDATVELLGLNVTLSPDTRVPPPQPQRASSPRLQNTSEEVVLLPREVISTGSLLVNTKGDLVSPRKLPEEGTAVLEMDQGSTEVSLDSEESLESIGAFALIDKPPEVTLGALWDLVVNLGKSITPQVNDLGNKLKEQKEEVSSLKQDLYMSKNEIQKPATDIISIKKMQEALMTDHFNLRRKVEILENQSRTNNLPLLNFPRLPMITPIDMLKCYFMEVLNVPEQSIPPFARGYYIPQKQEQQAEVKSKQGTPLDITNLLEASEESVAIPATLILTVALLPDKECIMRLYFKNRFKEFWGHKIQIYPDVSRETQKKKQQFLLLRPGVTSLGGIFFLRFPNKCIHNKIPISKICISGAISVV